ncbi:MAG: D-hexose-6-phosphate mutarotase [Pseudomonadota bacterium]|nr:D-hexose-6-phosphate mutarotase [Pseudomonadota bacterium]
MSARISVCQHNELPCLQVTHPQGSALIALQGAQVLEYTPHGQQPVIWLSEQAGFQQGQSVRGGIPVCWPWFGAADRNPPSVRQHLPGGEQPAHGWVRNTTWVLRRVDPAAETVTLEFGFPHRRWPATFPEDVELTLTVTIGAQLSLCLSTHNRSSKNLTLTQALHSYFAVSDVDQVRVAGLEQKTYVDTLAQWERRTQAGSVAINAETDRIYLGTRDGIEIIDSGWRRRIRIESKHSASAVVWNPWIDKGKRLSQFPDEAWRRMLCVETANVLEDRVELAPGDSCHLDARILVVND